MDITREYHGPSPPIKRRLFDVARRDSCHTKVKCNPGRGHGKSDFWITRHAQCEMLLLADAVQMLGMVPNVMLQSQLYRADSMVALQ